MTHIANFVKTVQERAALKQLEENGELGRCEECDEYTDQKDDDGAWWCGCSADTDDDAYNDPRRA